MTPELARAAQTGFSILLIGLAMIAARADSPRKRALVWLGLINLASMASPAAWGDYVPVGTLWMATVMLADPAGARRIRLAALALYCGLLPGVVPIGSFPGETTAVALSMIGTLLIIGVNGFVVARAAGVTARFGARLPRLAPAE